MSSRFNHWIYFPLTKIVEVMAMRYKTQNVTFLPFSSLQHSTTFSVFHGFSSFPPVYGLFRWHHSVYILLPFDRSYDRICFNGSPRFELSLLQSTPCKYSRPTILCTLLNSTSGSKYLCCPYTVNVVVHCAVTFGLRGICCFCTASPPIA